MIMPMKHFDNDEYAKLIQANNRDAYEYVFIALYENLCLYAMTILKDKDASEEVVQDIFVKLWENRDKLDIQSSIKSYLFRSVHNSCLNYLAHIKVRQEYSSNVKNTQLDMCSPHSLDYPIANLLVQELDETIERAVNDLPEQCRNVFKLIRYEEMTYLEVADKLDISINTVKTQMSRALMKLRENLKEFLPILLLFLKSLSLFK